MVLAIVDDLMFASKIKTAASQLGLTVSFPVGRRYSAKVAYGSGLVARTGTDFKTVAIAWQVLWLSPKWSGR